MDFHEESGRRVLEIARLGTQELEDETDSSKS